MDSTLPEAAGLIKKNTTVLLLSEGNEQVITVQKKIMLNKIISALGYSSPPIYTEIDCGVHGVKFSITLDLSFVQRNRVAVVEGAASMDKSEAENNAVMMAFSHLAEHCHIRVLDFSSRVARSFGAYNIYGTVNEAMDAVEKVFEKFENTLAKCKDVALDLDAKLLTEKIRGDRSGNCIVYDDISNFISSVFQKSTDKVSIARSKMNEMKFQRMIHHNRATEKSKAMLNKLYAKNVVIPSKDLLNYVLAYLGIASAKYSNGPDGHGMVDAVAKFTVPYIERLKFCGKLEIRGRGASSIEAEEDAAFKALLLIEENFSVKIVDVNHSDRLEAELVQSMLVKMLDSVLEVGEDIKDKWVEMSKAIEGRRGEFSYQGNSLVEAPFPEEQLAAYKVCTDALASVELHSSNCYDACSELFKRLNNITCTLSVIKIKLDIV